MNDGNVLCTLSKFIAYFIQFILENVRNRSKTVLVTLMALNTRNLSKIINVIVYELMLPEFLREKKRDLQNSISLKFCYLY